MSDLEGNIVYAAEMQRSAVLIRIIFKYPVQHVFTFVVSTKGGQAYFIAFRTIMTVGADAPDFTATAVETGELVELKDYWQDSDLCVEFGSLT